jgi:hypothetical protein
MIYATLSGVSSLRELSTVMLACDGRISHLSLKHFPKRSTLSDANKKRSSEVFGVIYSFLYKRYAGFLSDSNGYLFKLSLFFSRIKFQATFCI